MSIQFQGAGGAIDSNMSKLGMCWHDSAWLNILNQNNIMDYFSDRSNTFYDRSCNNEIIKMQRLNLDQLKNMTGLEYELLHVQEPILYVIRKQHRHSPTQVTPLADYYIVGGIVYQAPDLGSVVNSRLVNTLHFLQSSFNEAKSFSRYYPSKGYWWEFKEKDDADKVRSTEKKKKKEEPSSLFQRQRVDMLLAELANKFPPKIPVAPSNEKPAEEQVKVEPKEIKQERDTKTSTKGPPEKKQKIAR